ncbi:hypothetical protein [Paraburkholderia sp. J11-2]|uniref:hypothetical protein n=1 Tax=Paraburkholderia sp. J11-2 TaxID=2805431 RepID=UPI002AB5FC00|nr:hypothetical protein [Paraburkholderia sp. J11-2]
MAKSENAISGPIAPLYWLRAAPPLRAAPCPILAERPVQPHVILRVATLDDDPGARPEFDIWTSRDVPWLTDDGETPHHPEWAT